MGTSARKGFTLVELLVVVALLGIFFAAMGQAFTAGRGDYRGTWEGVAAAVDGALRDSTSGWGGLAQDKGVRDDASLLPERYGVVFLPEGAAGGKGGGGYWSVQTQDRTSDGSKWRRVTASEYVPLDSPFARLARVVGRTAGGGAGQELPGLAVLFKNPSGKPSFDADAARYVTPSQPALAAGAADTLSEFRAPAAGAAFQSYDLEFVDDRGAPAFTLAVGADKTVTVTLP